MSTGLRNVPVEIAPREKRNNFCFRTDHYIIFVDYVLKGVKLFTQRIYSKIWKYQSIDVFRMYIFQSFTRVKEHFPIRI